MKDLFKGVYAGKKIFVTGHTGFKGSWLVYWLNRMGATVRGYSLEAPTNPNHLEQLDLGIESTIDDICNGEALKTALCDFAPDMVFHLAAQPLVGRSYREPLYTFNVNIMGSLNLYEAVRSCPSVKVVVSITTDKVYQNNEWHWGYRENDILGGKDPYSASKAAMEIVTTSYRDSFFNLNDFGAKHQVLLSTVRAGNVIGGGDWAEDRLIPDIVKASINNTPVSIRSPYSVRPWQHVLEPLSGYLLLGQKLWNREERVAEPYNFGPLLSENTTVEEVVQTLKKYWDKIDYCIERPQETLAEAGLLRLDCSKAEAMLGWKPVWSTEEGLRYTIGWYRRYYEEQQVATPSDLDSFVSDARQARAIWARK